MYIRAHVTADARRDRIEKVQDGVYAITVRAPAEGNQANTRVRELVADELALSTTQVRIVSGHQKGSKMIHIDN